MREVDIERQEKVARWTRLLVGGCLSRGVNKNWGRNMG